MHTAGWPLENDTYGGSFLYHMENNQVVMGFITGLDYSNPWLSPFEEFQRWKTHPNIRWYLEGDEAHGVKPAKRISYGARAITAGGLLSLPKTVFPGGALVGCDAGYLNASRIKGSHAAIKTGMLAAQAAYEAVTNGRQHDELTAYPEAFEKSWLHDELNKARNFKTWFKKGLWPATIMNGIEQFLFRGRMPWTLHRTQPEHTFLKPASQCKQIVYPKPDGKITFDRLSSVFISNTNHAEDQPAHLTLKDATVPVQVNLSKFAGPESRYCPAGVYEFVKNEDNTDRLQINAQNCVHCKTCDIKDPTQNIVWVTPEGGGGPNYVNM
jgi:electron-transferring-flavoprotein dehydrogenase